MASKVVETKIIKLGIDDKELVKGLRNATEGLHRMGRSMKDTLSKVDGGKVATGIGKVGESITRVVQKVPGLNSLVDKIRSVGKNSDTSSSLVGRIGESISKTASRSIPVIGGIIDAVLNIGKAGGSSTSQLAEINSIRFDPVTGEAIAVSDAIHDMGDAVDQVGGKFQLLQQIAVVALGNIAAKAIESIGKGLYNETIGMAVGGYHEYIGEQETQRVLEYALRDNEAYDGESIDAVMRRVEAYALDTKYSAGKLNNSLGTFVNAGLDLNESADAMLGFLNLAAASGASAAATERALEFGLKQSMSVGYMQLADWKSLENANVTSMEFQQRLVDRAYEMGIDMSEFEKFGGYENLSGAVRQSMTTGKWMTKELMVDVLGSMAHDDKLQELARNLYSFRDAMDAVNEGVQNRWSSIWRNLFGNGSDPARIFTGFGATLEHLKSGIPAFFNTFAEGFNRLGGTEQLLRVFDNLWGGTWDHLEKYSEMTAVLPKIFANIKFAFMDVFPPEVVDMFMKGPVEFFRKLADSITISDRSLELIRASFRAFFTVLKGAMQIFSLANRAFRALIPDNLLGIVFSIIGAFTRIVLAVGNVVGAIVKLIIPFDSAGAAIDGVASIVNFAGGVIEAIFTKIGDIAQGVGERFKSGLDMMIKSSKDGSAAADGLNIFEWALLKIINALQWLRESLDLVGNLFGLFIKGFETGQGGARLMHRYLVSLGDSLGPIGRALQDFLQGWIRAKDTAFVASNVFEKMGVALGWVFDTIKDKVMVVAKEAKYFFDNSGTIIPNFFANVAKALGFIGAGAIGGLMSIFDVSGVARMASGIVDTINRIPGIKMNNPFETMVVSASELEVKTDATYERLKRIHDLAPVTTWRDILTVTRNNFSLLTKENGLFIGSFKTLKIALSDVGQLFGRMTNFNGLKVGLGLSDQMADADMMQTKMYKLGKYISDHLDVKGIAGNWDRLKSTMWDIVKNFPDHLSNLGSAIRNVLNGSAFKGDGNGITNFFKEVGRGIKEMVMSIPQWVQKFANYIGEFKTPIANVFGEIADIIRGVIGGFQNGGFGTLVDAANIALVWKFFNILDGGGSIIERLKSPFTWITDKIGSWKDFGNIFSNTAKGIKKISNSVARKNTAEALKDMAYAVGILAASALALTFIPEDRLLAVTTALGGLVLVVGGMYALITHMRNSKYKSKKSGSGGSVITDAIESFIDASRLDDLNKKLGNGAVLIGIAAVIASVVYALKTLTEIDLDSILKALGVVGLILLGLTVATKLIQMGDNHATLGDAALVVSIAIAIGSVVKSIGKLTDLINSYDPATVNRASMIIGAMMVVMGLSVALMGGEYEGAKRKLKWGTVDAGTAAVVAAIGVTIGQITKALDKIVKIGIGKAAVASTILGLLMGALGAMIILMGGEFEGSIKGADTKLKWGTVDAGTAAVVAAIGITIGQIAKALDKITKIGLWRALGALPILATLMLTLGAMIVLMGGEFGGNIKGIDTTLKWGTVDMGTAAVVAAIGVTIGQMANAVKKIASVPIGAAYAAAGVISGLMVAMGIAVSLMGGEVSGDLLGIIKQHGVSAKASIKWGTVNTETATVVAAIAAAIMTMGGAVKKIGSLNPEDATNAGKVIEGLMKALGKAVKMMGGEVSGEGFGAKFSIKWGSFDPNVKNVMLGLVLAMRVMVNEVKSLSKYNPENVKAAGDVIKGLMFVMGLAVMMMSLDFSIVGLGVFAISQLKDITTLLKMQAVVELMGQLADAVAKITSSGNSASIGMAGLVLAGLMTVIGIIAGGLGLFGQFLSFDIGAILSMVAVAGVMYIAAMAIERIADVPADRIEAAGNALSAILIVLGIITLINNVTGGVGSIVGAAGLAIMAGSLLLIANALNTVGQLDSEQIKMALIGMGGALGILLLAAGGAILVAPGLVILTAALLGIAAAAVGFGTGAVLIGTGANLIVEALERLYSLIKTILGYIRALFEEFLGWFGSTSLGQVLGDLGGWFGDIAGGAFEWGGNIAKSVGDGIDGGVQWVKNAIGGNTKAIDDELAKSPAKAKNAGSKTSNDFAAGVNSNTSKSRTAGTNVADNATTGMNSKQAQATNAGKGTGDKFVSGVTSKNGSAKTAGSNMGRQATSGMNSQDLRNAASNAGGSIANSFINSIRNAIGGVASAMSDLMSTARSFIPNSPAKRGAFSGRGWHTIGTGATKMVRLFASGIEAGRGNAISAITNVVDDVRAALDDVDYYGTQPVDITPVFTDTSAARRAMEELQTYVPDTNVVYGVDYTPLQLDYSGLNHSLIKMINAQSKTEETIAHLKTMNSRLKKLEDLGQDQVVATRQGRFVITNLDGKKVSRELAPTMLDAQKRHLNRIDRIGGDLVYE